MGALKRVVMTNIQSHVNTVLEFPRVGIVRFLGDNSNGKSVMVKVLQDVVSNNISRPAARRSIIRRGCSYGELLLESYDGDTFFVRIATEAAQTYAELTKAGQPTLRRYLADKAIPVLVREFGWHFDDKHKVSINIHNDTDGFLFVDTRKDLNYDLLNSMRSDAFAESALAELDSLLKKSQASLKDMNHLYDVSEATFVSLQTWNIEEEQNIRDEALYYAELFENLTMPRLNLTPLNPRPTFYKALGIPPKAGLPTFYKPMPAVPPVETKLLSDMATIIGGSCPTCGQPLVSGGHAHVMV